MAESRHFFPGKIGVVTVTFNSAAVLKEFYDSLAAQTHTNFVLYVIDNASKDETISISRQRSDLKLILISNQANLGVAEANNQGISAALANGCEYILLLNNDTVFAPDLIAKLCDGLTLHDCSMTTPKIYYHDRPNVLWCVGGRFHILFGFHTSHYGVGENDEGQYDTPRQVAYTPTCCLLIRREVFDEVGIMDSRYFVYSDDADFLYRCMKSGVRLWYVPEAKLWHKVSALTGAESDFSIYFSTRNHILFLRKHLPAPLAHFRYWQSRARALAALLSRKIGLSTWSLREKAAREGWDIGSQQQSAAKASNP